MTSKDLKIIDLKLTKYFFGRLVSCFLSIGIIIGDWSPPKSGIAIGGSKYKDGVKPTISLDRSQKKAVKNVPISLKVFFNY